VLAMLC